jgi:hypothetical protein
MKDKNGDPVMFHPGQVTVKQVDKWFQFMRPDDYYLDLLDEKTDNSTKPSKTGDALDEMIRFLTKDDFLIRGGKGPYQDVENPALPPLLMN